MTYKEAADWLKGNRTTINTVPQDPFETWIVRIAEADAHYMEQAYWVVRAHKEGLVMVEETK